MLLLADTLPATPATSPAAQGLLLAEFAGVTLAFPQSDIVAIQHSTELQPAALTDCISGWFPGAHELWPVLSLDGAFQIAREVEAPRSFVVLLKAHPTPIGLSCESVRVLSTKAALPSQPLPPAFGTELGIEAVARITREQLAFVFGAGRAATLLWRLRDVSQEERWR
jgi:hypothetical protein